MTKKKSELLMSFVLKEKDFIAASIYSGGIYPFTLVVSDRYACFYDERHGAYSIDQAKRIFKRMFSFDKRHGKWLKVD